MGADGLSLPTARANRMNDAGLGGTSRLSTAPSAGVVISRTGRGARVPGRVGTPINIRRVTRSGRARALPEGPHATARMSDERRGLQVESVDETVEPAHRGLAVAMDRQLDRVAQAEHGHRCLAVRVRRVTPLGTGGTRGAGGTVGVVVGLCVPLRLDGAMTRVRRQRALGRRRLRPNAQAMDGMHRRSPEERS